MRKVRIVNNLIEISSLVDDEVRYININSVILVSKIANKDGELKIAINFENVINKIGNYKEVIPDFQYVFGDKDFIEDSFSLLKYRLEESGNFFKVRTINGDKIINLRKINSFLVDSNKEYLFINLNSSISSSDNRGVVTLSTKCSIAENPEIIEKLIAKV